MQLKKLEIYGFKSFADKTVIEFPQGITAIVGPNGSGKSNVADAIRWVLGEQSARELRGEKVEDFIFSGSLERHRLGYAQVSLTFDNSDGFLATEFSELTITRKAYRTGESEYYINKSRCRLKDIQELFLDTGLGKNSFAMVSQGQVDAIVEAKPKERRLLFDEAAGINKYKAKKDETLRKLERTKLDLSRATDIAIELENRLEPLKDAKEKAEKYLEISKELNEAKESLMLAELWELWQGLNEAKKNKAEKENELIGLNSKLSGFEATEAKVKEELRILDESISSKQQHLYGIEQSLQDLSSDLRVYKERKENLYDKSKLFKETIREKELQIAEKKGAIKKARDKEENLKHDLFKIKETLTEKQKELEEYLQSKQNARKKLENLKDLLFEKSQEISEHRNTKNQVEREIELGLLTLTKIEELLAEKRKEQELTTNEVDKLTNEIKKAQTICEELTLQIKNQAEFILGTEEKLKTSFQDFHTKQDVYRQKSAQLKALETTEAEYYGYYEGVRSVLKASLPGVLGVVAKLVDVPDHITKAAEAVLGAQLQGIVTQSDVAAEKAIRFLRENRQGRATFYPLNLIEARPLPEKDRVFLNSDGVLGLLADFLGADSHLRGLTEYLGGRTFVTDSLENARKLAQKSHSRYRIVTLDGDVIWSGGTMTGGEEKEEKVGLLKRQSIKRDLQDECQKEAEHLEELEKQLEKAQFELKLEKEKLEILKEDLRQEQLKVETLKARLWPLQSGSENCSLQIEKILKELSETKDRVEVLQNNKAVLDNQKDNLLLEEKAIRENLQALSTKEWTDEDRLRDGYQRLKDQETSAKERVSFAEKEKEDHLEDLKGLMEEHRQMKGELVALFLNEIIDRQNILMVEKTQITTLFKSDSLRKTLSLARDKRAETLVVLEQLEDEIKRTRPMITLAENNLRDASTVLARLEGQLETLKEKAEEMAIVLENLDESVSLPKAERVKLSQRCKHLEREVAKLGHVNIGAIEEYKEVSERYSFLETQINDLIEAKEDLMQVLAKLDKISRERFMEAFLEIKAEFERLFKELFQGGEATLVLEEGDILEAGVEIKAQPPGKKLQSIALLSGGEKALTAIALIFAVICVRRVPFYLFDEIDAPLDEANLERYVELVKEKAKGSQIILITHRRRSMEAANLLYGVTMEEKGVSKIISLRLEDEEAAAVIED